MCNDSVGFVQTHSLSTTIIDHFHFNTESLGARLYQLHRRRTSRSHSY